MSFGFFMLALAVLVFLASAAVASFAGAGAELANRRGARWVVVVCRVVEALAPVGVVAFVVLLLGVSLPVLVVLVVAYFAFDAVACKASGWLLRFYDKRAESRRV